MFGSWIRVNHRNSHWETSPAFLWTDSSWLCSDLNQRCESDIPQFTVKFIYFNIEEGRFLFISSAIVCCVVVYCPNICGHQERHSVEELYWPARQPHPTPLRWTGRPVRHQHAHSASVAKINWATAAVMSHSLENKTFDATSFSNVTIFNFFLVLKCWVSWVLDITQINQ